LHVGVCRSLSSITCTGSSSTLWTALETFNQRGWQFVPTESPQIWRILSEVPACFCTPMGKFWEAEIWNYIYKLKVITVKGNVYSVCDPNNIKRSFNKQNLIFIACDQMLIIFTHIKRKVSPQCLWPLIRFFAKPVFLITFYEDDIFPYFQ
jgi:hypothetical protein